MNLIESILEDAALTWYRELGFTVAHGLHIAPGEPVAERDGFGDVILVKRLCDAVFRLNPGIPTEAQEDAVAAPSLVQTNRTLAILRNTLFSKLLIANGVTR